MPLASRPRATSAASAIMSLSFSRGVRFICFLHSIAGLARPHFRHSERAGANLPAELLENVAQGESQVGCHLGGKPNDHEPANRCRAAVALKRRSDVAQGFQPCLEIRPEID